MSYRGAALAMGRRMAEAGMQDQCRVTRHTGTTVINEETGALERATITVYEGKCSVLSPYRVPSSPSAAGLTQNVENQRLDLPMTASTGIHSGDVVEITYAHTDPDMLGRRYTVSSVMQQSDATARRIPVKEVS